MNQLYSNLKLNSFNDWETKVLNKTISQYGGKTLLRKYSNDRLTLLNSVYPNYPWRIKRKKNKFGDLADQRAFMDSLFQKFRLRSLEDWKSISRKKIVLNGGKALILTLYKNNIQLLLSTIYPEYSWNFEEEPDENKKRSVNLNILKNQEKFMKKIYNKLQLESIEQWKDVSRSLFIKKGGKELLALYSDDFLNLLQTIYPDQNWSNYTLKSGIDRFKSIDNQREFMNSLFIKLKLSSLDEWLSISKRTIIHYGGRSLLTNYYQNNLLLLLRTIYPTHPWKFEDIPKYNGDHFSSLSTQREWMDHLYAILDFKTFDDWLDLGKRVIIHYGGESLLSNYSGSKNQLLVAVYPNFPWYFKRFLLKDDVDNNNGEGELITEKKQKEFMDELYKKLGLKSIDEWDDVPKYAFAQVSFGRRMLKLYNDNIKELLSAIYPDYSWLFSPSLISYKENQLKIIERLIKKLKINSMYQLLRTPTHLIALNGGRNLLNHYSNSLPALLQSLYPNYPWRFTVASPEGIKSAVFFKSIINQRLFMDDLFTRLGFTHLDDWLSIHKNKIIKGGGQSLLKRYYRNDYSFLLSSVYPNYSWNFKILPTSKEMEDQQKFCRKIMKKMKYSKLDDLVKISKTSWVHFGGKPFLIRYSYNIRTFLSETFPQHTWPFDHLNQSPNEYFKDKENQFQFMLKLNKKLGIKELGDWLIFKKKKIVKNGGQSLLYFYYQNSVPLLLKSIFPNYPWDFTPHLMRLDPPSYFKNPENQREFLEKLYKKLGLTELDEFAAVTKQTINRAGGRYLLKHMYKNDICLLLSSVYPHHPWQFDKFKALRSLKLQRLLMEQISQRLKLKDCHDWLQVHKSQIISSGGRRLLELYNYNMKDLLITLYPSEKWGSFEKLKYRRGFFYSRSLDYHMEKVLYIKNKYLIRRKEDWYRLTMRIEEINLYRSLTKVYPSERWKKDYFISRFKKTAQRKLKIHIERIYPAHNIIENYRPPFLQSDKNNLYELDLFLPSLYLAFEYQGEQHYDDIPSGFNQFESYLCRDQMKVELAIHNFIHLVRIPFWWDELEESLQSSIHSSYRISPLAHPYCK